MTIPVSIIVFILGLIVSLVGYIWGSLSRQIAKIEKEMDGLNLDKIKEYEPVTMQQIKELFDARFNEFRLELYRSGVLKAKSSSNKKNE
jgi:hypothetical protein